MMKTKRKERNWKSVEEKLYFEIVDEFKIVDSEVRKMLLRNKDVLFQESIMEIILQDIQTPEKYEKDYEFLANLLRVIRKRKRVELINDNLKEKLKTVDNRIVENEIEKIETEYKSLIEAAGNKMTPIETLKKLGELESPEVLQKLARNKMTPIETLKKLSKRDNPEILQELLKNRNTPVAVLKQLRKQMNQNALGGETRENLESEEFTEKNLLAMDPETLRQIAKNNSTPAEVFITLSEIKDKETLREIAKNRNTPAEVLITLSKTEDKETLRKIAKNDNTPAEILRKLAEKEDPKILGWIAWNDNTPAEILEKLSKEENIRGLKRNSQES